MMDFCLLTLFGPPDPQGSRTDTEMAEKMRKERDTARTDLSQSMRAVIRLEAAAKQKDNIITELKIQLANARQSENNLQARLMQQDSEFSSKVSHLQHEMQRYRAEEQRLSETLHIERAQFVQGRQLWTHQTQQVARRRFEIEQRLAEAEHQLQNSSIGRMRGNSVAQVVRESNSERRKQVNYLLFYLQKVANAWAVRCSEIHKSEHIGRAYIFTFGSFWLGVDNAESDVDVLVLAPPYFSRTDDFFGVGAAEHGWSLAQMLRADERATNLVLIVDAHVPLLKMNFGGMDFDLTFANGLNSHADLPEQPGTEQAGWGSNPQQVMNSSWQLELAHDMRAFRSVNGVLTTQSIAVAVPDMYTFQIILQRVKVWAKHRGLYGGVLGYLGGISWALLVAAFCQQQRERIDAHIANVPNTPQRTDSLLALFFEHWNAWDWPHPVSVGHHQIPRAGHGQLASAEAEIWDAATQPALMPILTSVFPRMNTTHSVSASSCCVIKTEMARACSLFNAGVPGERTWTDLAAPVHRDFMAQYPLYIQIHVRAASGPHRAQWLAFVKASLRHVMRKLDAAPHRIAVAHLCGHSFDSVTLEPISDTVVSAGSSPTFLVGITQSGDRALGEPEKLDHAGQFAVGATEELAAGLVARARYEGWHSPDMVILVATRSREELAGRVQ
jgi:poly(A) polymerase Pap1